MKSARPNPPPGPLLLKDHLVEDVSSCSSNGFGSYPRRECCTTVRLLLEADLRDVPTRRPAAEHPAAARRAAEAANRAPTSGVVSALQRASKTVIKAVRNLHIAPAAAAVKSERQSKAKKPILPANFSRKLLKRNVNKKQIGRSEIERWKVYNQFAAQEISKHSDSNSSSSNSQRNSDSTVSGDSLPSSSYSSEGSSTVAQNDAVAAKSSPAEKAVRNRPSVRLTNAYLGNKQKQLWSIPTCNVEKEQWSPVSVLDYPLEDEDEASSPIQTKLNIQPETMKKLLRRIKRFESLTQIEAPPKPEPPPSLSSPLSPTPKPEDQSRVERDAESLLRQLESPLSETDTPLLLDFFRCGLVGVGEGLPVSELVKQAEDWVSGECSRFWYEWEVEEKRKGYIEGMERGWKWKRVMDVENGELAMELERYVSSCLVNELVADLLTSKFCNFT